MSVQHDVTKQTKVILWSTPRSLSTVLMKCLSSVPDPAMWFEPYTGAMFYGPEATLTAPSSPALWTGEPGKDQETLARQIPLPEGVGYDVSNTTYKWCQEQLEGDYPAKRVVFVKELSFAIATHLDAIPHGYKHSFLIRNPLKVLPSWKKSNYVKEVHGPYGDYTIKESIPVPGYFFKESYDLYQHIADHHDPNPIVLDADDLLMNPDRFLKAYCIAMDIPYTEDLLHWDSSKDVIMNWNIRRILLQLHNLDSSTWLDNAAKSSEFLKPSEGLSRDDLSEDDRRCVDFCMPFYEKLYEKRLIC